jgi:hypothetical protein
VNADDRAKCERIARDHLNGGNLSGATVLALLDAADALRATVDNRRKTKKVEHR